MDQLDARRAEVILLVLDLTTIIDYYYLLLLLLLIINYSNDLANRKTTKGTNESKSN